MRLEYILLCLCGTKTDLDMRNTRKELFVQLYMASWCARIILVKERDNILIPGDGNYHSRINLWWSLSSRLTPWCIVQPRSAQDVSAAVKAFAVAEHGYIAICSGGHSHWAGGSNIQNGVTINLGRLKEVSYNLSTKIASLGPAQIWDNVFETLEKQGIIVPGGRDGGVGVAGLMTWVSSSYYTDHHGFVYDNLVNAEVVHANENIVNSNSSSHSDLSKALKSGWGNFGIRYKV